MLTSICSKKRNHMVKVVAVLLLFTLLTGAVLPASPAEAAVGDIHFADGQYHIQLVSGLYVGLESTEVGAQPVVTKEPYLWNLTHRNGHIQLASASRPELTLEVQNSSLYEWGAKVQIYYNDLGYSCKEIQAVSAGGGAVFLRFEHSGLVLDVKGGAIYTPGTPLWQYRCHSPKSPEADAQKLFLKPVYGGNTGVTDIQQRVHDKSLATIGNGSSYFLNYFGLWKSIPWCALYAQWVLHSSLTEAGYASWVIDENVPKIWSTTSLARYYDQKGLYHSYTQWYYNGISMNVHNTNYTPKVGDMVLVEANPGTSVYSPDHTAIIIEVYGDGSFLTAEGNSGSRRTVNTYKYVPSGNSWARANASSIKVHGICEVQI